MSVVTISLSDNQDGQGVIQEVKYLDGFNPNSQAHHYSAIMLKLAREAADKCVLDAAEPEPSMVLLG